MFSGDEAVGVLGGAVVGGWGVVLFLLGAS